MKKKLIFLAVFGLVALVTACRKNDLKDPELAGREAEYAFPLFSTDLQVSDLVSNILQDGSANDTIIVNDDQTITLIYAGDVAEEKAIKIFSFFQDGYLPIPDTTSLVVLPAPAGVSINQVQLRGGNLYIGFRNTTGEPVNVKFWMPGMTKDGNFFSVDIVVPPAPLLPAFGPPYNLAGWELQSASNSILFKYYATRSSTGEWVSLNDNGIPGATVGFEDVTFSFLKGIWSRIEYPLSTDTIEIDINQINLQGDVKIKNPKVTMSLVNSFGFPTRGLVKKVIFIGQNDQEIPLVSPQFIVPGSDVGIDFAYPSFAAGEVGQSKTTTFYFDDTNSNIEEIFNARPKRMIYEVVGLANAESDPNLIGFITDSSSVRLNVKVELLLEGQLTNFGADQTLDLDFSGLDDGALGASGFESAEFKLVTDNSIPLSNRMQVYFRNAAGATVDSLFVEGPQEVIRAASVDPATGLVTSPTRTETFIPFTAERFERLKNEAKQAFLQTYFTTANGGTVPVKILNNQSTAVRMGVRLKTSL
jgi:hypothetical protein